MKPALRYLRPHHLPGLPAGLLGLAALNAACGASRPVAPALYDAGRVIMPAALAIVAVASLHSSMDVYEQAAGHSFRRAQWAHLGCVVAVAAMLVAIGTATEISVSAAVVSVRAVLANAGLAMVCGRILGWLACWPLPLAVVIPLSLDGQGGPAGASPWWAWSAAPPAALQMWTLPAAALAIGGLATYVTAWRTAMAWAAARSALRRSR